MTQDLTPENDGASGTPDDARFVGEYVIRPDPDWDDDTLLEKCGVLIGELEAFGRDHWGFVLFLTEDDLEEAE